MTYVVLGKDFGEIDPGLPRRAGIPYGTEVRCRMPAGGILTVDGNDDPSRIDESLVLLGEFQGPALNSNWALGHLLDGDAGQWIERQFDAGRLILPGVGAHGDPVVLCTDTAGMCPNTWEQLDAGLSHACEGVLGRHPGEELDWIICQGFGYSFVDV